MQFTSNPLAWTHLPSVPLSHVDRRLRYQVNFVQYLNTAASFRRKARTAGGDGWTVASVASGSSKGTKTTIPSELSNITGGSSQGGSSVFSHRSVGSKSSTTTGISKGTSGEKGLTSSAIPPGSLEGSAFVVPAQEVNESVSVHTL